MNALPPFRVAPVPVFFMLLGILSLFSCAPRLEIGEVIYQIQRGSEAVFLEDPGVWEFSPAEGSMGMLFGLTVTLDHETIHRASADGRLLKGVLAADLQAGNSHATFTIPAGSSFEYSGDYEDYLFMLPDGTAGRVEAELVGYPVHEFFRFNKDLDFMADVAEKTSFMYGDREILLIKNDSPVWYAEAGLDYEYYSVEYRDRIEKDILTGMQSIPLNEFQRWFDNHEAWGVQYYNGSPALLYLEAGEGNPRLEAIEDPAIILKNFQYIPTNRPDVSSYEYQLQLSLTVPQSDGPRAAELTFIVPDEELEDLRQLLVSEEPLYLLLRMGIFSDIEATGFGMLYYVYSVEHFERLIQ